MKNYASFNAIELLAIFGDSCDGFTSEWSSVGVSTDSRTIEQGNIFVALKGEKYDGHDNIPEAIAKGASAIIVSTKYISTADIPTIAVPDTLIALGELATFHRNRYNFPVIAVAGSNGKTSTKELIYSILSQRYRCLRTYKNFNNTIGVPQMLLQFSNDYDMAIIEIGTNMPGEISTLSNMVRPTYGIITNIGKEHLELLTDLDLVEIEETFLLGYLLNSNGKCFINADDLRLSKYRRVMINYLSYGIDSDADFNAAIEFDEHLHPTITFTLPSDTRSYKATLQAVGLAIAHNAVAAAAVGYGMGLSGDEIVAGLNAYVAASDGYARMVIEEIGGNRILNDCYNANPSSMVMSLKTLSMMRDSEYKVAVLGDMFELGDATLAEHIEVIEYSLMVADKVLLIGDNMLVAADSIQKQMHKIIHFSEVSEIATYIKDVLPTNCDILVKASRGMRLETLINLLKNN
ncbi:MAG: UDP-N-acetylmuramoyl-tripeptide--D-alanyl-D-alanine ligase [Ignavibacteria bacterium]|jgi:UDP-N-acetylmuramoyl-tripeptide--D-alanyl-D-alanine ligase|nr:UDP-N-acetylmuramoyl-tripeptide--D-alanyl-D-alanine ligase [Ignavibacteria bacterium]